MAGKPSGTALIPQRLASTQYKSSVIGRQVNRVAPSDPNEPAINPDFAVMHAPAKVCSYRCQGAPNVAPAFPYCCDAFRTIAISISPSSASAFNAAITIDARSTSKNSRNA
jgi:hypothetical protein